MSGATRARRRNWSFQMEAMDHAHLRWLDDQYRGRLTEEGRIALWGVVAACLLLLGGISAGLARTAGLFLALAGVAWLSRPPPMRLRARRLLPPPPAAGEVWGYTVEIENLGAEILTDLHVEERGLPAMLRPAGEPPVILSLAPGEIARVTLQLHARRRGACVLDRLQIASAGSLGMVKRGVILDLPDRFLVYPAVLPCPDLDLPASPAPQPGGIPLAARVGESAEFLALRPWRPGDRLRDMDWRAFARTGRPAAREYQEEYFVRLALVVDISSPSLAEDARVERALSRAAGIIDHLARRDFLLDIFAAGSEIHRLQAGRGVGHLDHVLGQMAALTPGPDLDSSAIAAALAAEARQLSAVFFLFTARSPERESLIGRVREMGLLVVEEYI